MEPTTSPLAPAVAPAASVVPVLADAAVPAIGAALPVGLAGSAGRAATETGEVTAEGSTFRALVRATWSVARVTRRVPALLAPEPTSTAVPATWVRFSE